MNIPAAHPASDKAKLSERERRILITLKRIDDRAEDRMLRDSQAYDLPLLRDIRPLIAELEEALQATEGSFESADAPTKRRRGND